MAWALPGSPDLQHLGVGGKTVQPRAAHRVQKSVPASRSAFFAKRTTPAAFAPALQHLEARAFGCLFKEFARTNEEFARTKEPPPAAAQLLATLRDLQRRCQQPTGAAQPLFATTERDLAALRLASAAA